jgi:hypothetical protein
MITFHHRRSPVGTELHRRPTGTSGVCCSETNAGRAVPSIAVGAFALGAIAVGALSVGVLAVGRMVVGRLLVRLARIGKLEIGTLKIGKLDIAGQAKIPDTPGSPDR